MPALIEALGDRDAAVEAGAATALGRIGPKAKAAVPMLDVLAATSDHF